MSRVHKSVWKIVNFFSKNLEKPYMFYFTDNCPCGQGMPTTCNCSQVTQGVIEVSQFQISNWDHCFWWAWIKPLCKSGLDSIDCKSSWFHSSIKINNHLNILNHLPDADHLAPEVGVGAVAKSSGAPGWVGAANTVWVPRGAVAVGAVPAVYGSGHPPAPPHPCANPPRSLSRHQVPWQHGRTVAGLGSAVKGVRAADTTLA